MEENIEEDIKEIEYEILHNLLALEDNEKFKDHRGIYLDIEVRGERHKNNIYFKVNDISLAFGITYLKDALIRKEKGYIIKHLFRRPMTSGIKRISRIKILTMLINHYT